MSKCFLRTKKYLLIVAICLSCCAINGCVVSIFPLATDSRLPKWLTLPPGLTRADVIVIRASMGPTRGVKYNTFGNNNVFDIDAALLVKRHKKLDKTLAKGSGKLFLLPGLYNVSIINGMPEITGFTRLKNEHGDLFPYFYVVDDPTLKRKLLDENEKKLLEEIGADYPAVRKKLLDENGR